MAPPFPLAEPTSAGAAQASPDPRALRILAKSIYRELRQSGLAEQDVMGVAGELLSLVAGEVKDRRVAAKADADRAADAATAR